MIRGRGLLWAGLLLGVGLGGPVLAKEAKPAKPAVTSLSVTNNEETFYLSFEAVHAFLPEITERVDSGLEVTFTYLIKVKRRRSFWLDAGVLTRVIKTTVLFDGLTRQYALSRTLNGSLLEETTTSDRGEVERWMTRVERLPLFKRSEYPDRSKMFVKVKAEIMSGFVLLFIPWDTDTKWQKIELGGSQEPAQ